ncbi:MarR family winged helix-turn-helix transcriptional regulator [Tsukamurella soli]
MGRENPRGAANAGVDDVGSCRDRLIEELRTYGAAYNQLGRVYATWQELHASDAQALMEIVYGEERGEPLTPARLGSAISLSSGATTALLNRLEAAGHIVRSRESVDRRVVTLRTTQTVHRRAEEFFGPLSERFDAIMSEYPDDELERFHRLLTSLQVTMQDYVAERS